MKIKMIKKYKIWILIIFFLGVIIISSIIILNFLSFKLPTVEVKHLPDKYFLNWDDSNNKSQTYNNCGAYSTRAYILLKSKENIDPEEINRSIKNKLANGYTLPWGLIDYIKSKKLKAHIYWFGLKTKKQKIIWIKSNIINNDPIICIVGDSTYLHYITIIGFDTQNIYVYDSGIYNDKTIMYPGNDCYKYDDFIKKWSNASINKFKINLAICE